MKQLKTIILLVSIGLLVSCGEEEILPKVNLKLINGSNATFTGVTLLTNGGMVLFKNIAPQDSTEYKEVSGLSDFINLEIITTNQDTLRVIQIDPPRDASFYTEGNYACQISIVDSRVLYEILKY